MILEMEKLSVFGLLADRETILSKLMRGRCVEFSQADAMDDYEELKELTESGAVESFALEQQLARYQSAVTAMHLYSAKAGLFAKKPRVLYEDLEDGEMLAKADELCEKIEAITGTIADARAEKSKDQFALATLEPWAAGDLPLELTGTRATEVRYFLLSSKADMPSLEAQIEEERLICTLSVVGEDSGQRYLLCVVYKADAGKLWDVLKSYGATRMSFEGMRGTAAENIAELTGRIERAERSIADCEEQLREIGKDIFPLKYAADATNVRVQREKVGLNLRSTERTFCFTGWVPKESTERATSILDKYGCYYELRAPNDDEEPPILLRNNAFATPYEAVTDMYSPPAYRGFDPNTIMSVFYFIMFGMMLSDAGFGLVLFVGGLFLSKKMDLGENGKKLVRVITMGGLSALFWGTIFGSWFGDVFEVVARVFFGREIHVFQLIDPLQDAVIVMGLSCALGFVHILVGMGIKAYMLIRDGKKWDALFDIGFWYLILIGLVAMLAAVIALGDDSPVFTVGAVMAAIGAAGVVLTGGRDKKNPLMRIGSGITSLYDVSGYLSDVLSYSRILALGLATGVIAQVFNIMGTLGGGGIVGVLVFIPVFVLGSALNLGINTLGAYVHTARLQYVEFYGKFYEAGGKPFRPFAAQTKYLVVTNKEENS